MRVFLEKKTEERLNRHFSEVRKIKRKLPPEASSWTSSVDMTPWLRALDLVAECSVLPPPTLRPEANDVTSLCLCFLMLLL